MELNIDSLKEQIPYYLTQEAKENLVKALQQFPNVNYYTNYHPDEFLQGDGWSGLGIIDYESGEKKKVKGIILSNSCDIDKNNKRDFPPKIMFAPIIKLSKFNKLLSKNNISSESIDGKLGAIRQQIVTSIFYLPKGGNLEEEYLALLDDVHNISYELFNILIDKKKAIYFEPSGVLFVFVKAIGAFLSIS